MLESGGYSRRTPTGALDSHPRDGAHRLGARAFGSAAGASSGSEASALAELLGVSAAKVNEARILGKDDVGAQPSGVFLCAASLLVSKVRSRLRRAPTLVSPAFVESIPSDESSARYGPGDS